MITRAGWTTVVGAGLLAAAGATLGLLSLHVLAATAVLLVVAAVVQVRVRRPEITVRRMVRPARVHVGTTARVELEISSSPHRATSVLTLVDPIGDRTSARLRLAPMPPRVSTRAAYRLPTRRRGEVPIGPLAIEWSDALGLARRFRPVADHVRLVVLPQVEVISPLPRLTGSDPLSSQRGRPGSGPSGDEFHSLRPYVVGDDLRRVHWPMSARRDELVIRVDEEPHQARLTVVLDQAEGRADTEIFERMVSAAASIASAHWQAGDLVRLLCTDGRSTGWVTGQAAFDGLLELLAVTERVPALLLPADLTSLLSHIGGGSDSVAVVVGDLSDAELLALPGRGFRGAATALTVVRFRNGQAPTPGRMAGTTVIDVDPERPFSRAWSAVVTADHRRRPAPRSGVR